jgi:hypothetical protein
MASTVRWLQLLISLIDQDKEPYRFEKNRLEFTDEVEALHPLTIKAAEERPKFQAPHLYHCGSSNKTATGWNGLIRQRQRRKT